MERLEGLGYPENIVAYHLETFFALFIIGLEIE